MADFKRALQKTLGLEGGYSNDSDDLGGATIWGITEAVAKANGYTGDMRKLPLELAQKIYKKGYWDVCRLDECNSQIIAENVFDCAVNAGPGDAARFLQQALNALNCSDKTGQEIYPLIPVDGGIGPITINTVNLAIKFPGREIAITKAFNCLRGADFIQLGEKRAQNKKFMLGWLLHRVLLDVSK
jgi:lysozyme family protein